MNNTLAVISQSGESLTFFDITTGTKTGQIKDLNPEPHELCYDSRSNLLYISHAYEHGWYPDHGANVPLISVVDVGKKQVVDVIDVSPATGVHYLALDKERNVLYASVEAGVETDGPGGIVGIDLKSRKVVRTVGSGWKTHWFVMTPGSLKAYCCNKETGFVSVIDLIEEKLVKKIEMPGGCEQPGISNDGKLAYFATPTITALLKKDATGKPAIKVIDTTIDEVAETIPMDRGALSIHVDAKDRLLVGQYERDPSAPPGPPKLLPSTLVVLAGAAEGYRKLGEVQVGEGTLTLFSSADGSRGFTANGFDGTVSIIDLEKMKVERTLGVDMLKRQDKNLHQGAHGLALVP